MIPNAPGATATIVSPGAASTLAGATTSLAPDPSEQRQAVEAVLAAERIRTKTCEEEESFLTADELRAILKRERKRASKLQGELASSRYSSGCQPQQSEVLEEGRINGLMRRMDVLQEEKGRIMDELEREEMVRGQSTLMVSHA
jgi:Mg2+/Co2+ transporter CorC